MAPFPVELWHTVFDNLDRPEWIALVNTCRTFRNICRPYLYQELYADLNERHKRSFKGTELALHVMRSRDRELAGFVKEFTLEARWEITIDYSSIPEDIRYTLPLCVNLRSLCLSLIRIDHGFCDLVAGLPHLNDISYVSCDIALSLIEDSDKTLADSKITDVTIADPSGGDGWSAAMPSNPRFLDINCISVEAEDIVFSIFEELMDFGQSESLKVFTMRECPCPSNLVDFLESCHQLRRIELPKIPIALVGSFENLQENTLTNLKYFSGYAKDAGIFFKGRSIHTAELTLNSKTPVDALQALGQSTGPVTKLKLVKARHITPEKLQYGPTTLRELELRGVGNTSCLSALSRFPDLQILTISDLHMSREKQAAVVNDASVVCVSLREIILDDDILRGEQYTWRWRREGPWERFRV